MANRIYYGLQLWPTVFTTDYGYGQPCLSLNMDMASPVYYKIRFWQPYFLHPLWPTVITTDYGYGQPYLSQNMVMASPICYRLGLWPTLFTTEGRRARNQGRPLIPK